MATGVTPVRTITTNGNIMYSPNSVWLPILALAVALASPLPAARAQVLEGLPEVAEGIGVEQKIGQRLPLGLDFDDDKNNQVFVNDLFDGKLPVLLSFNYSDCPQLCVIQLNNLASALQHINLVPGRDFRIVSVSLDPNEQTKQLAETKRNYVIAYGDLESSDGWHFLRGKRDQIRQLTDACGFKYKYIPDQKIYSHPSAFIFCTPDGRIARYLDGLSGDPPLEQSLKPALLEAGQGKIGSLADKVLYFSGCYVYDPANGKYSLSAIRLMRLGGVVTIVALVAGIAPYWIRRRVMSPGRDDSPTPEKSKPDFQS